MSHLILVPFLCTYHARYEYSGGRGRGRSALRHTIDDSHTYSQMMARLLRRSFHDPGGMGSSGGSVGSGCAGSAPLAWAADARVAAVRVVGLVARVAVMRRMMRAAFFLRAAAAAGVLRVVARVAVMRSILLRSSLVLCRRHGATRRACDGGGCVCIGQQCGCFCSC